MQQTRYHVQQATYANELHVNVQQYQDLSDRCLGVKNINKDASNRISYLVN